MPKVQGLSKARRTTARPRTRSSAATSARYVPAAGGRRISLRPRPDPRRITCDVDRAVATHGGGSAMDNATHLGLDVHKDTIAVAVSAYSRSALT